MGRIWVTALCLAMLAWTAYNMLMDGFDISCALLAMFIMGALLVLELIEKRQENKVPPLYVMSDMHVGHKEWKPNEVHGLIFDVDALADSDIGSILEKEEPDIDYVA